MGSNLAFVSMVRFDRSISIMDRLIGRNSEKQKVSYEGSNMTLKNKDVRSRKEEESRWINWAIWLPIAAVTTGAAIWVSSFVIIG